jgi:membrane protein HdeD
MLFDAARAGPASVSYRATTHRKYTEHLISTLRACAEHDAQHGAGSRRGRGMLARESGMAAGILPNIRHINRMMWLGWALMALGLLSIFSPLVAGKAAVIVIGLILLAAGLGLLLEAFQGDDGGGRLLTLVLGVITSLSGIVVCAHPLLGLGFLTLLLVIYFVADGVWKIIAAFRYMSVPGWLWLLASGALSLLLGLLIWRQWPVSGLSAVGLLIGVNLLATGFVLAALARSLKNTFRNVVRKA